MKQHDEDMGGAVMIFIFIALLILKAMDFELSWWVVTSPIWVPFIYLTFGDAFLKKRDTQE